MSVLTYQDSLASPEVAQRIEELTRAIYELDPYFVPAAVPALSNEAQPDEPLLALSLMVSTGDRAKMNRRTRSPDRRARPRRADLERGEPVARATLAVSDSLAVPQAPTPRARSPIWILGSTTYAEILKGQGSRSSSIGSRHASAQRRPACEEESSVAIKVLPQKNSVSVTPQVEAYSEFVQMNVIEPSQSGVSEFINYDLSAPETAPLYTPALERAVHRECTLPKQEISEATDLNEFVVPEVMQPEIKLPLHRVEAKPVDLKPVKVKPVEYKSDEAVLTETNVDMSLPTNVWQTHDMSYAEILLHGLQRPTASTVQPTPQRITANLADVQRDRSSLTPENTTSMVKMSDMHSKSFKKLASVDRSKLREDQPQNQKSNKIKKTSNKKPKEDTSEWEAVEVRSDLDFVKSKKDHKSPHAATSLRQEDVDIKLKQKQKKKFMEKLNESGDEKVEQSNRPKKIMPEEQTLTLSGAKEDLKDMPVSVADDFTIKEQDVTLAMQNTKQSKKRNKNKKVRTDEDEIDKALKEIEESLKSKKKTTEKTKSNVRKDKPHKREKIEQVSPSFGITTAVQNADVLESYDLVTKVTPTVLQDTPEIQSPGILHNKDEQKIYVDTHDKESKPQNKIITENENQSESLFEKIPEKIDWNKLIELEEQCESNQLVPISSINDTQQNVMSEHSATASNTTNISIFEEYITSICDEVNLKSTSADYIKAEPHITMPTETHTDEVTADLLNTSAVEESKTLELSVHVPSKIEEPDKPISKNKKEKKKKKDAVKPGPIIESSIQATESRKFTPKLLQKENLNIGTCEIIHTENEFTSDEGSLLTDDKLVKSNESMKIKNISEQINETNLSEQLPSSSEATVICIQNIDPDVSFTQRQELKNLHEQIVPDFKKKQSKRNKKKRKIAEDVVVLALESENLPLDQHSEYISETEKIINSNQDKPNIQSPETKAFNEEMNESGILSTLIEEKSESVKVHEPKSNQTELNYFNLPTSENVVPHEDSTEKEITSNVPSESLVTNDNIIDIAQISDIVDAKSIAVTLRAGQPAGKQQEIKSDDIVLSEYSEFYSSKNTSSDILVSPDAEKTNKVIFITHEEKKLQPILQLKMKNIVNANSLSEVKQQEPYKDITQNTDTVINKAIETVSNIEPETKIISKEDEELYMYSTDYVTAKHDLSPVLFGSVKDRHILQEAQPKIPEKDKSSISSLQKIASGFHSYHGDLNYSELEYDYYRYSQSEIPNSNTNTHLEDIYDVEIEESLNSITEKPASTKKESRLHVRIMEVPTYNYQILCDAEKTYVELQLLETHESNEINRLIETPTLNDTTLVADLIDEPESILTPTLIASNRENINVEPFLTTSLADDIAAIQVKIPTILPDNEPVSDLYQSDKVLTCVRDYKNEKNQTNISIEIKDDFIGRVSNIIKPVSSSYSVSLNKNPDTEVSNECQNEQDINTSETKVKESLEKKEEFKKEEQNQLKKSDMSQENLYINDISRDENKFREHVDARCNIETATTSIEVTVPNIQRNDEVIDTSKFNREETTNKTDKQKKKKKSQKDTPEPSLTTIQSKFNESELQTAEEQPTSIFEYSAESLQNPYESQSLKDSTINLIKAEVAGAITEIVTTSLQSDAKNEERKIFEPFIPSEIEYTSVLEDSELPKYEDLKLNIPQDISQSGTKLNKEKLSKKNKKKKSKDIQEEPIIYNTNKIITDTGIAIQLVTKTENPTEEELTLPQSNESEIDKTAEKEITLSSKDIRNDLNSDEQYRSQDIEANSPSPDNEPKSSRLASFVTSEIASLEVDSGIITGTAEIVSIKMNDPIQTITFEEEIQIVDAGNNDKIKKHIIIDNNKLTDLDKTAVSLVEESKVISKLIDKDVVENVLLKDSTKEPDVPNIKSETTVTLNITEDISSNNPQPMALEMETKHKKSKRDKKKKGKPLFYDESKNDKGENINLLGIADTVSGSSIEKDASFLQISDSSCNVPVPLQIIEQTMPKQINNEVVQAPADTEVIDQSQPKHGIYEFGIASTLPMSENESRGIESTKTSSAVQEEHTIVLSTQEDKSITEIISQLPVAKGIIMSENDDEINYHIPLNIKEKCTQVFTDFKKISGDSKLEKNVSSLGTQGVSDISEVFVEKSIPAAISPPEKVTTINDEYLKPFMNLSDSQGILEEGIKHQPTSADNNNDMINKNVVSKADVIFSPTLIDVLPKDFHTKTENSMLENKPTSKLQLPSPSAELDIASHNDEIKRMDSKHKPKKDKKKKGKAVREFEPRQDLVQATENDNESSLKIETESQINKSEYVIKDSIKLDQLDDELLEPSNTSMIESTAEAMPVISEIETTNPVSKTPTTLNMFIENTQILKGNTNVFTEMQTENDSQENTITPICDDKLHTSHSEGTSNKITENKTIEKLPVHSLHDLLPEIDSIPEFKPSFSTPFFSNLSADAPEFKPSYQYSCTPQNQCTDDLNQITYLDSPNTNKNHAPGLLNVDDNKRHEEIFCQERCDDEPPNLNKYIEKPSYSIKRNDKINLKYSQESEVFDDKPFTINNENISCEQTKSNKKKNESKKNASSKNDIETISHVASQEESMSQNVWPNIQEEGKSYAGVLTEGTVVSDSNIFKSDHSSTEEFEKLDSITSISSIVDDTTKEPDYENNQSWAKIVGVKAMPHDQRGTVKLTPKEQMRSRNEKKLPMICVADSDEQDNRQFEESVDSEGFIRVGRSKRSRSRSRDTRERQKSRSPQKKKDNSKRTVEHLSFKPEKKYPELSSTKGDSEDISMEEGNSVISDEPNTILTLNVHETSEDRNRCSMPEVKDQSKSKNKKKRRNKKATHDAQESGTGYTAVDTVSSYDKMASNPGDPALRKQMSSSESLHTPVKDRMFSENQFWNVQNLSQDIVDESNCDEDILTRIVDTEKISINIPPAVTLPDNTISVNEHEQFIKSESFSSSQPNKSIQIDKDKEISENLNVSLQERDLAKSIEDLLDILKSENAELLSEKSSEEISLDSQFADLQREIEEMLTPELEHEFKISSDTLTKDTETYHNLGVSGQEVYEGPLTVSHSESQDNSKAYDENNQHKHQEQVLEFYTDESVTQKIPILMTVTDSKESLNCKEDQSLYNIKVKDKETKSESVVLDKLPNILNSEMSKEKLKQSDKYNEQERKKQLSDQSIISKPVTEEEISIKKDNKVKTEDDAVLEIQKDQLSIPEPCEILNELRASSEFIENESKFLIKESIKTKPAEIKTVSFKTEDTAGLVTVIEGKVEPEDNSSSIEIYELTESAPSVHENLTINLQLDNFWIDKAKYHDAEKILALKLNESTTNTQSQQLALPREDERRDISTPGLIDVETEHINILPESAELTSSPINSQLPLTIEKLTSNAKPEMMRENEHISDTYNSDILVENLQKDSFWIDKHKFDDAECEFVAKLTKRIHVRVESAVPTENDDTKDRGDRDPDGDSGSSGRASDADESFEPSGDFTADSDYMSMDLPGGVCGWKDRTTVLALADPTPCDSALSSVGTDFPEDILTSPLRPPPLPLPAPAQQQPLTEPATRTPDTSAKDDLSNDIEVLLAQVRGVQARLADLPADSLAAMMNELLEGISVLRTCQEAADLLDQKAVELRQEPEIQALTKDLSLMKVRISKLLAQAQQGVSTIQVAKDEQVQQTGEMNRNEEIVNKLDDWLSGINTKLQRAADPKVILSETDLITYIQILEQYLLEYKEYEQLIITAHQLPKETSLRDKLETTQRRLTETKILIQTQLELLRQSLADINRLQEPDEEDLTQTDRTIDSSPMPEEVVTPRRLTEVSAIQEPLPQVVPTGIAIETQTGKSLISDPPSVRDVFIDCKPEPKRTQDVAVTCAPPVDVEIQTSEKGFVPDIDTLENILIKQTTSEGHETIEIASKPVIREQTHDNSALFIDANYNEDLQKKNSELNITHSLPQSFETIMVEPDETTTEVVIDADGTKRIIVRKVRKTLVSRQQTIQTREHFSQIMSSDGIPENKSFSKLVVQQDQASTSTMRDDGAVEHVQYKNYGGQIISGLPGGEVTIQEFTSKPNIQVRVEESSKPEELFARTIQYAEGDPNNETQIHTSSSSVTAVVQQVTKRIVRTRRRIIKRIVTIDGKEHITEEIIEEPDSTEVFEEQIPKVTINVTKGTDFSITEIDDGADDDKMDSKETKDDGSINKNKPDIERQQVPEDDEDIRKINKNKAESEPAHILSEESPKFDKSNILSLTRDLILKESEHTSEHLQSIPSMAIDNNKQPVKSISTHEDQLLIQKSVPQLTSDIIKHEVIIQEENKRTDYTKIDENIPKENLKLELEIFPETCDFQHEGPKLALIESEPQKPEPEPDFQAVDVQSATVETDVCAEYSAIPTESITIEGIQSNRNDIIIKNISNDVLKSEEQQLRSSIADIVDENRKQVISEEQILKLQSVETPKVVAEVILAQSPTVVDSKTREISPKKMASDTLSLSKEMIAKEVEHAVEDIQPSASISPESNENEKNISQNIIVVEQGMIKSHRLEEENVMDDIAKTRAEQISIPVISSKSVPNIEMLVESEKTKKIPKVVKNEILDLTQEMIQRESQHTLDDICSPKRLKQESQITPQIKEQEPIEDTIKLTTIDVQLQETKVPASISDIVQTDQIPIHGVKEHKELEQEEKLPEQTVDILNIGSPEIGLHPIKDALDIPSTKLTSEIDNKQIEAKTINTTYPKFPPIHELEDHKVIKEINLLMKSPITPEAPTELSTLKVDEVLETDSFLKDLNSKLNDNNLEIKEHLITTVLDADSLFKPLNLTESQESQEKSLEENTYILETKEKVEDKKLASMISPSLDTENIIESGNKLHISTTEELLHSERQDSKSLPLNNFSPSITKNIKEKDSPVDIAFDTSKNKPENDVEIKSPLQPKDQQQIVEIKMSLKTTDVEENKPHVSLDMTFENYTNDVQNIVKKDIDVGLPSITKISCEIPATKADDVVKDNAPQEFRETIGSEIIEKAPKRSKKKKKHKSSSDTSESHTDSNKSEAHKSPEIEHTHSSSLDNYIDISKTSLPKAESPKPSKPETFNPVEIFELEDDVKVKSETASEPLKQEEEFIDTSSFKTEGEVEDIDYEPGESSISDPAADTEKSKIKRKSKRQPSGDTIYPDATTAEADDTSVSTPVEMLTMPLEEKKKKRKSKSKKKLAQSDEELPSYVSETNIPSPKVEIENSGSLPCDESYHTITDKSEVTTVKIVEECVQSSPELIEKHDIDSTLAYTVPVVEAIHTQDYSVQTSPDTSLISKESMPETPIRKPEVTHTALQTSPTPQNETVVQTSPIPEKVISTQTSIEEIEVTAIPSYEPPEQSNDETQTSISPIERIEQVEAMTQVASYDIFAPEERFSQTSSPLKILDDVPEKPEPIATREMQTSPIDIRRLQEDKSCEVKYDTSEIESQTASHEIHDKETCTSPEVSVEVETIEISSQTPVLQLIENETQSDTTMEPEVKTAEYFEPKITAEISLQTVPKETSEIAQQTTPRNDYADESPSTSTDEPYEIHLRTQISVPRATAEFLDNEKTIEPVKSRKRQRHKKKMAGGDTIFSYRPTSPESLSDPLTTELSVSVTPTSGDELTSQYTSSVDGAMSPQSGIAKIEPDDDNFQLQRLTYSDVVRSKSKSPDFPSDKLSKTTLGSSREQKLLGIIENRIQNSQSDKSKCNAISIAVYEPEVEKSYDTIVDENIKDAMQACQLQNAPEVEKHTIIIVETISTWLQEIQYRIETITRFNEDTSSNSKLKISKIDNEERLRTIKQYVNELKQVTNNENIPVSEDISNLVHNLDKQLSAVQDLSKEIPKNVKQVENVWLYFIEEVNNLYRSVEELKIQIDEIIMSELPTEKKLDKIDQIDFENFENVDKATRLYQQARNLVEENTNREIPTKLFIADEATRQIENNVNIERDRLLQISALAEEYEQTLKDFGQITDVADALLDGKIIVSNLEHLHEEIQKHRKFFVNLSHCRAILESLEGNLDNETRLKYSSLHTKLHDRATIIIDRATSRAQQMTLAASRWSMLVLGMKEEQQWLRVAHQRIPDLATVTSIDHEQYIHLYQVINSDVTHHQAKLLRLLSIAEGLQGSIQCSGIERECTDALTTVLKLQEDIETGLTRLMAFRENWITYDHLIDRIEAWMKVAHREIQQISPDLSAPSGNLRRFWELKAQHELHNNLKNDSGVQFERALEILPVSDEMIQREFFSKLEDEWRLLSNQIDEIQRAAIQTISDRDLPSARKLDILEDEIRELRGLVDGLKGVIKNEDELHLYIERLQVMSGRIDRIQNELGRMSLHPTTESDRLLSLLAVSRILESQIAEELERSLLLKEKILSIQSGIARSRKSQRRAQVVLDDCKASEKFSSDVVDRAVFNCDNLASDLADQWQELLVLRQALHTLPMSLRASVSPVQLERDISALQDEHTRLENECASVIALLRSRLELWRRFERQLELVHIAVREADYMVELLTVQGQVDYDRLLKATEKLEGLSSTMSRRSDALVGELRAVASPLAVACDPAVAAQMQRDLDSAAAAYDDTCRNLNQLCDKYQRAVQLWRQYRDAAAAVRAWTEGEEGRLHALRPEDARGHLNGCEEQARRVEELRALAARVAAETGSQALQADADALGRRLEAVCGAVRTLADIGEARQRARTRANNAHDTLRLMNNELTPVQEDSEVVEDKLVALRDNLLSLGRAEGDLAPAAAELPDIDRDSGETSIVKILELWQLMFRDTFLHYHRLSSTLVRSGDATTALRLWHEYLLDLQSFLSGSIPEDYENLTEHRHLCKVHQNLLSSQRSVLLADGKARRLSSGDDEVLAEKFNVLTNLHNETLARIVERHDEVSSRIATWESYRESQNRLLRWLKQMEREKEKLQLRYVHMKRVDKVLMRIQGLLDQIPNGRDQCRTLLERLKSVLQFSGDTYGASVRMESAGIVKRVDNLQAGLETWRDFLARIIRLISEYEILVTDLTNLYSDTQDTILSYSDEDRSSRPHLRTLIQKFGELQSAISKTSAQLEALSVIQEQLKECLSPQDIRTINQRVWQLRQQQSDLEHQLSIIGHRLQDRLEIYTIFESRLTKFVEWLSNVEARLETSSQTGEVGAADPQDLIRRINADVQAETSMKEREFEWLIETGTALVELSRKDEKAYSKNTKDSIRDIQERWLKLLESSKERVAKITQLIDTIYQLEERLSEIRIRLHAIETRMNQPIVLENLQPKDVDDRLSERNEIQKDIDLESGEIGEVLNHCELVFNDADTLRGNFDVRNLRTGTDIVERKWRTLCDASARRKQTLRDVRKATQIFSTDLATIESRLSQLEKRIEKVEERRHKGKTDSDNSQAEAILRELKDMEEGVLSIERAYGDIAAAPGVELRDKAADDAARGRNIVSRWRGAQGRLTSLDMDAHHKFVNAHGQLVVALAQADVRLTRAQHLPADPDDIPARLRELDEVERAVRECETLSEAADRLAESALESASEADRRGICDMVGEYRALLEDVGARLVAARRDLAGDVDSAVQVETLKFETDAALQVDTLTSRETYRAELCVAVRETEEALEALRTVLRKETVEGASADELAAVAREIAKAGSAPSQPLELAKHLSELLLTECDADEEEALLPQVGSLTLTYEELLTQAKKRELHINNLRLPHSALYALSCEHETGRLTCPLCSDRNWKQLDNDLWRLEQWLQFAEATEATRAEPPAQYDELEDAIQEHREFLLDLDSHKSIVVSLNIVGAHVAQHAGDQRAAAELRARLAKDNARWDAACESAAARQRSLQQALVHNQQFHDIVVELVARLGEAERGVRAREPLRLTRPADELRRDFRRFSELRDELERTEPRVHALHEAAQLLRRGDAPPQADDICRRLGELRLRLQSLRKLSGVYALKLGAALARHPSQLSSALAAVAAASAAPAQLLESEEDQLARSALPPLSDKEASANDDAEQELTRLQRGLRFVCRVARASLPFQALLLLLLGAAALAPGGPADSAACRPSGLALEPVLRYPDGPPPM